MTSGSSIIQQVARLAPVLSPAPAPTILHPLHIAGTSAAREDFFTQYFEYTSDTECPVFFHRWCCIAGVGAFLGRSLSFSHGQFSLYPNVYSMLVGVAGTRKSTAIKLMKKLLVSAGYTTLAADKTSKEKFLLDLAGDTGEETSGRERRGKLAEVSLDLINIFGEDHVADSTVDKEMLIAADEFNDFFGNGNIEFASMLGSLWDYSGIYKSRIKTGRSVAVYNPTVSILGGNTPTNLSLCFPPEILGQGFFSRLLLVYGEPTGKKITFPKPASAELSAELIQFLYKIKQNCAGELTVSTGAEKLLDKIYKTEIGVDDVRFDSYNNRRFTHLLKLCITVAACNLSKKLSEADVLYANTILTHTERLMPKALGEFGKSRHSDVMHRLVQILEGSNKPLGIKDLWEYVVQDLDKLNDLAELMRNLVVADKVQSTSHGFLPKRKVATEVPKDTVDFNLLTQEEIGG